MRDGRSYSAQRRMASKFASTGSCGHPIAKGDEILWSKDNGAICPGCARKWTAEVAEEEGNGPSW